MRFPLGRPWIRRRWIAHALSLAAAWLRAQVK